MLLRSAGALRRSTRASCAKIARRTFVSSTVRLENAQSLKEVKDTKDLIPAGAPAGTVPTDMNQATGLERFEILGKMEGIDVFDMKPLDASRPAPVEDPIIVDSLDPVRYIGCTGYPANSQEVVWLTLEKGKIARCPESGQCYKMNYIGPDDVGHGPAHH